MACLRVQQSDSAAGKISCGVGGIKCEANSDTGLVVVYDRLLAGVRCDLNSGEGSFFLFIVSLLPFCRFFVRLPSTCYSIPP